MKIIIESIKRPETMSDEAYAWLLEHLNEPLAVSSINFNRDGKIAYLAVFTTPDDLICLFNSNGAKFKFIDWEDMTCADSI